MYSCMSIEIASNRGGENLGIASNLFSLLPLNRPAATRAALRTERPVLKINVGRVPHHIPPGFVPTVNVECCSPSCNVERTIMCEWFSLTFSNCEL